MFEYEVTIRPSNDRAKENVSDPLTFTGVCHDDMVAIARRGQKAGRFTPDEAAQLAIGLKLFGEIVLRHRKEEDFLGIYEAIHEFMPKMKAMNRGEIAPSAEAQ